MKLAVQYEMQRGTLDDHRVIEETLEQCILADEVGFDYVWLVEHHFPHLPVPRSSMARLAG